MAFGSSFIKNKLISNGYVNINVEYKDFLLPGIPRAFVKPSIAIGAIFERMPFIRMLSQSIYISAQNH